MAKAADLSMFDPLQGASMQPTQAPQPRTGSFGSAQPNPAVLAMIQQQQAIFQQQQQLYVQQFCLQAGVASHAQLTPSQVFQLQQQLQMLQMQQMQQLQLLQQQAAMGAMAAPAGFAPSAAAPAPQPAPQAAAPAPTIPAPAQSQPRNLQRRPSGDNHAFAPAPITAPAPAVQQHKQQQFQQQPRSASVAEAFPARSQVTGKNPLFEEESRSRRAFSEASVQPMGQPPRSQLGDIDDGIAPPRATDQPQTLLARLTRAADEITSSAQSAAERFGAVANDVMTKGEKVLKFRDVSMYAMIDGGPPGASNSLLDEDEDDD